MNDIDKFSNLFHYFSELTDNEVNMTFKQIEKILDSKLCRSAFTHRAYWYVGGTHTFPKCWVDNGYKMTTLDLIEQKVSFIKTKSKDIRQDSIKKSLLNKIKCKSSLNIEDFLHAIEKYNSVIESDENTRFLSWEHCFKVFHEAKNKTALSNDDTDLLSLNLAFYLASWGLLRGSSFLLQKDYKVHKDIINEIFNPCYDNLWYIKYNELQKRENLDLLFHLSNNIRTIYRDKRINIKDVTSDISDNLITHILLGTLGCIPAYDEYFKKAMASYKITVSFFNDISIIGLTDFYEVYLVELEKIRMKISKNRNMEYPQMKILDIAFWQLGMDYK